MADRKRRDPVKEYLSRIGRKGALAVNESRTTEERQEIAKRANDTRWAERRRLIQDGVIKPTAYWTRRYLAKPKAGEE